MEFIKKTQSELLNQKESAIVVDHKGNLKLKCGDSLSDYLDQWLDIIRPQRTNIEDTEVIIMTFDSAMQMIHDAYMFRNMGC